jgi:hypothetical protein
MVEMSSLHAAADGFDDLQACLAGFKQPGKKKKTGIAQQKR